KGGAKGGTQGAPKKQELAHAFYWAPVDALRGDWQGTGGLVAQVMPTADKIYSKEDLIPSQDDNFKYEGHLVKAFDEAFAVPVAILNGTLNAGVLPLSGDGWTGSLEGGHLK